MPRHRGVQWFMAVAIVALFCGSPNAGAESFTYQGHTLKYTPPPGYCGVDREGAFGSALFSAVGNIAGPNTEPIAIFLDCTESSAVFATHNAQALHHFIALAVFKTGDTIIVQESGTRRDWVGTLADKFSSIDLAAVKDELKQRLSGLANIPELKEMRLVEKDNDAAYVTMMTGGDGLPDMVAVMAGSMTNQLPFAAVMVAPASDPNVLQSLLDGQHRYMSWLISLNETDDEQRKQVQPTPGFSFSGDTLGFGSILIGGLCLLGALIVILRLRRS